MVALLLGAILAFGAFSFAPAAHAAGVSAGPDTSVVEIITRQARSVLVKELGNPHSQTKCYNTSPQHVITIRGLKGEVALSGYFDRNCLGVPGCRAIMNIPPNGHVILRLC